MPELKTSRRMLKGVSLLYAVDLSLIACMELDKI